MTSNEKWHGNSRNNSSSGAGRDGKPFEKRDVKSILKGSRGAAKFSSEKPAYEDKRQVDKLEFKKKDASRPAYGDRKPYENRGNSSYGERKPYGNRDERPAYGERKPYENRDERPAYGERKPYEKREDRPAYGDKPRENRPRFNAQSGEKTFRKPFNSSDDRPQGEKLAFKKPGENSPTEYVETRFDNKKDGVTFRKPLRKRDDSYDPNAKYSQKKQVEFRKNYVDLTQPIRLNKFLANAGICSRREADEYIQAGVISVNGEVVSELGVKVMHTDKVMFHNQLVRSERKVYLLLNKPKDCVTTSEDTHDRLTVVDLVKNACSERIYPVGRLDRNTTGVILLTNDGDLASRLTHPKYDKKKIYHAALDKALEEQDFQTIMSGVTLDDGVIAADALEYVKEGDPKQVGIEIHSGQNRVVRRIFEKLGYKVVRLDRVYFAGLTKKNLPRGKYRFLNEREINMLKMGAYE